MQFFDETEPSAAESDSVGQTVETVEQVAVALPVIVETMEDEGEGRRGERPTATWRYRLWWCLLLAVDEDENVTFMQGVAGALLAALAVITPWPVLVAVAVGSALFGYGYSAFLVHSRVAAERGLIAEAERMEG